MQLAVVLMNQLTLWTTDANCLVLVCCLVGLWLSKATVVQSETGKVTRRSFVMEKENLLQVPW